MSIEVDSQDVDLNNDAELELGDDTQDTENQDSKSDKPSETPEQRVARLKRQLAREEKKLGLQDDISKPPKSNELDYGQLAYLAAKNIDSDEDIALVQTVMAETGKSLKDVLSSKFFQAELKEQREARETRNAIPDNSKRTASPARDSVEYWLAKGEMPPADKTDLRRQYVNAKARASESGAKFSSNPVVS